TRAGGIPEVVLDGETGLLVEARDPRALGDAIVRLITDGELRGRMRTASRRRAIEFSVERMTDRTIAVYERVLEAARTGAPRSRAARANSVSSDSVTGAP